MKKPILIAMTGLAVFFSATVAAHAHDGATGVIKERMEHMKAMGAANKILAPMLKGGADYDAAKIGEAASEIHDRAGEALTGLFPDGSIMPPSEALPAIWQDWPKFEDLASELEAKSAALSVLADDAGSDGAQGSAAAIYVQMAGVCSGCHEDFRAEKE